jgi:protoporphyrin/coproporphyrin ferrochelatase
MKFLQEPTHTHGRISQTAIVLVNLGTPDAPTAAAVRPYLREFLSDPRVVEIPKPVWWLILNCFILPFRPKVSAHKYASIWTRDGSPLKLHTEKQAMLLRGLLGERGFRLQVVYAMRYGNPSLSAVLEKLKQEACERILILPAYPQYSGTTTASVFDAVFAHYARVRNLPELRLVKNYHDHPGYIGALRDAVWRYWQTNGRPDRLVISFHGVPKRTLWRGDPYHCECRKTARLLAEQLGLDESAYVVCFQSRFGKAEWLQPYTSSTLRQLGQSGVGRVDVICPGFIADCLETLEEIAIEGKSQFLAAGGKEFHTIPCLNEDSTWIAALGDIVQTHLAGWPISADSERGAEGEAKLSKERAARMGAKT